MIKLLEGNVNKSCVACNKEFNFLDHARCLNTDCVAILQEIKENQSLNTRTISIEVGCPHCGWTTETSMKIGVNQIH